jgi:hypothetical protein
MIWFTPSNQTLQFSSYVRNTVSWATKQDAKSGFASHDAILAPPAPALYGPKYWCRIPLAPWPHSTTQRHSSRLHQARKQNGTQGSSHRTTSLLEPARLTWERSQPNPGWRLGKQLQPAYIHGKLKVNRASSVLHIDRLVTRRPPSMAHIQHLRRYRSSETVCTSEQASREYTGTRP